MQLSKRSEQVTLSLNLNEYGSIGAGYFDVRAGDGTRTRLINLSYSKPLWGSSSVYLSANREVGDSQWAVQAQLVIPFDLHGTLALGMERSKEGETCSGSTTATRCRRVSASATTWAMPQAATADAYRQADLTWRLQSVQLQAGLYGNPEQMTRWADASGSVV
jgi:outer membrane usher protein